MFKINPCHISLQMKFVYPQLTTSIWFPLNVNAAINYHVNPAHQLPVRLAYCLFHMLVYGHQKVSQFRGGYKPKDRRITKVPVK